MSRIPVLERNEMDAEQQRVYDAISATTTGWVGRGPAIGFAYIDAGDRGDDRGG